VLSLLDPTCRDREPMWGRGMVGAVSLYYHGGRNGIGGGGVFGAYLHLLLLSAAAGRQPTNNQCSTSVAAYAEI
jgi:hypothetical protein